MSEKGVRFVGFDTAEEVHEGVLLDAGGGEEFAFKCRNRKKSVEKALASLLIRIGSDEKLMVVLEAPRAHGRVIFEVASNLGLMVIQVGSLALNRYRECEGQPRKDDHWDAYLGARMAYLAAKGCRVVSDPGPEERVLSRLTRARSRLVDRRRAVLNQLHSIILELAPIILDREWGGPSYDSVTMRKILKRWPAFEGIERVRRTTLEALFRSCRCRRAKVEGYLDAVRMIPGEVVVSQIERDAIAAEIDVIIKQVELLDSSIADLEKELREVIDQHPIAAELMKMPGIGLTTAAVLIGELLPMMRNTTEASAATYAGVTPLARKSGKSLNRSRLGRGSNKFVLKALFMSSIKAISCSSLDRAYYDKKRQDYQGHPKSHTAAILALSRQRMKVIYKIMVDGASYDKETLISSHLARQQRASAA